MEGEFDAKTVNDIHDRQLHSANQPEDVLRLELWERMVGVIAAASGAYEALLVMAADKKLPGFERCWKELREVLAECRKVDNA